MKEQRKNSELSTAGVKEGTMSMSTSTKAMKSKTASNPARDQHAGDLAKKLTLHSLLILASCVLVAAGLIVVAATNYDALALTFLIVGALAGFGGAASHAGK